MKPNFALHFTDDSVSLLHRTKRGWTEVGQTAFDVDDLPAALAALKSKADALAPGGVTTKLVIPNSQLKYIDLIAPGPDAAKRRAQIEAGLDGQTPYEVSELVYDWSGKGPAVQVVMVARETLDEAESFATQHGFNPVSFVAIPPEGSYRGEPWFGPSALASTLLAPGDKVERDQDPIHATATSATEPEAAAPAVTEPPAEAAPEPQPETAGDPPPAAEPLPIPAPEAEPEATPESAPEPAPEPEAQPEPAAPPPDNVPPDDLPGFDPLDAPLTAESTAEINAEMDAFSRSEVSLSEVTLPGGSDEPVDPARIAATLSAGDPPARAEMPRADLSDLSLPDMDEAPMAVDVDDLPDMPAKPPAPRLSVLDAGLGPDPDADDLPPPPSGAALAAFNRRGSGDLPAATRPIVTPAQRPAANAAAPKPVVERPVAAKPIPKFSYETPGAKPAPRDSALRNGAAAGSKALRGLGALVTAPSIPGGKKVKITTAATPSASTTATTTGTPTASGQAKRPAGLGSRPMPVRGKPRHLGLILTGILLVMLALAAALSSFYITRNDTGDDAVQTAAADPAITAPADIPAPEDEMLADMQDPADLADSTAADPAAEPPLVAPAQTAPAETAAAAPAPAPAPGTIIADDPAATAAPSSDPQDEIFLATADTAPAAADAAALPLPEARGDPLPAAQLPPPPFGTVYQFDENGLIRPTPEGITTPEGVLLTAGPPPRLPPTRPDSVTAAAAAAATVAAAAAPTAPTETATAAPAPTEPAVIIPADPALADARPLPRPEGLAPTAAPTAADDDAALAPLADPRLAGIRPATRPESLLAAAVAAGAIAPATASNDGSLALVAPEGTVTPIGLAISRRPAARPEDMNRAVEEAVAAAIRLPDEPSAEITPETEPEPEEVASAAPRIPSTANVAQQATVKNAINLREVNLIGVYGTSAERYALVRNPNGRYIKVEVGDRLDGGRVAAITASEVRYEKRGRMVVLALPNS